MRALEFFWDLETGAVVPGYPRSLSFNLLWRKSIWGDRTAFWGIQSCHLRRLHFTFLFVSIKFFLLTHILLIFFFFISQNLPYFFVAKISSSAKVLSQPPSIDWLSRNFCTSWDEFIRRIICYNNSTRSIPIELKSTQLYRTKLFSLCN